MAQGQRKPPKAAKRAKQKPLSKRQRTGASAKKTVRRKHHDEATKRVNAGVERRTAGVAARAGQHFELAAVGAAGKDACAEARRADATSKKQRREERAKEKAKAVAARAEADRVPWLL